MPAQSNGSTRLTVCLVTALSLEDYVDPELTAKGANHYMAGNIGVLTLASWLRQHGYDPTVVNLDLLFLDFVGRKKKQSPDDAAAPGTDAAAAAPRDTPADAPESFYEFVAQHLAPLSFDVYGLSSISSSYPLTVRLARELRRLNPRARIVLGGPQASVVDVATMERFPYVDLVLRGEADQTLPLLLQYLAEPNGREWETLPGLTFRNADGRIVRNANAPVLDDFDSVPLPAFDLDPDLRNRGSVYLELGRGCPFACTFCSTNDFFRRNFRLKSVPKMIAEMQYCKAEYGLANFSLIHDMYTIDRKKVVAFCEGLLSCGDEFTWGCSARTDCVDDELIGLMAKAGCRGIFFGIETGSERLQRVINKKLDLQEARERIRCADEHGIKTAVALITAFPDETREDLRDTIHFFVDTLRHDHAEPQMSLLAPLAGTPIHEQFRQELVLDHIFSDMSHQGWHQDPADLDLIAACPDVFPNFYAVPTANIPRSYFKEIRDFVTYVTTWFRWLPVALLQDSGDLLDVFDRWKTWLAAHPAAPDPTDPDGAPYYCQRRFRDDFLDFVRERYVPERAKAQRAFAALLLTEGGKIGPRPVATGVEPIDGFVPDCYPFPAGDLKSLVLDVDYQALVKVLRTRADLDDVPRRPTTIVFRPQSESKVDVWQLSPLSAALLRLCDGTRSVADIGRELATVGAGAEVDGVLDGVLDDVPAEKICLFGLMQLRADGLLDVSARPVTWETIAAPDEQPDSAIVRYSPPPQSSNTQQPWPWPSSPAPEIVPHATHSV